MRSKESITAVLLVSIFALSFAFGPFALATASSPNYPFELTGRQEYVAPLGTTSSTASIERAPIFLGAPSVPATPYAWVAATSYTTSPGHGI